MKRISILQVILAFLFISVSAQGQLFIGDSIRIHSSTILFSADSIYLAAGSIVKTQGSLETARGIRFGQGSLILTGEAGYVTSPVTPGQATVFEIGSGGSNNRLMINHTGTNSVRFKLAVVEHTFADPENKQGQLLSGIVDKTWKIEALDQAGNTDVEVFWNTADELLFNRDQSVMHSWRDGIDNEARANGNHAPASAHSSSPTYSKTGHFDLFGSGLYYIDVRDKTFSSVHLPRTESPYYTVYPNPAGNSTHLRIQSPQQQRVLLSVHDYAGRLIYKETMEVQAGDYIHTLNLSDYSKGLYTLSLSGETFSGTRKLVIQ